MSDVSDLLNQSHAAHLSKKRAAGTIDGSGNVATYPDWPTAENHIAVALDARLKAHALDPDHGDPAWTEDLARNKGVTHEALVDYYETYLKTDPQGPLAIRFADAIKNKFTLDDALTHAKGKG